MLRCASFPPSSHIKERYTHCPGGHFELAVQGRQRQTEPDRQLQVRGVVGRKVMGAHRCMISAQARATVSSSFCPKNVVLPRSSRGCSGRRASGPCGIASLPQRRASTSGADFAARGGTSLATGLPCLVMVNSSPLAARSCSTSASRPSVGSGASFRNEICPCRCSAPGEPQDDIPLHH